MFQPPTTLRILVVALLLTAAAALAGCTASESEAKPSTKRKETKTFELPPGGSVEYKLQIAKDAKLDYSWSTSRAITYDFHGDTGGESFTSHKKGSATTDQGIWTAPFDGRHGWWWKNNNRASVTVTLNTEGVYDIIGIV